MKKLIVLFLLILSIGIIYWWRSPPTVQGPSSGYEFEYIVRISGNSGSYDVLPMIIALHGHGDTPDNFFDTLLKDFDYPARFIVVKGPRDYPGVGLSGRAWPLEAGDFPECGDALADAVPVLLERYPTEGRPIVLGFSGGAHVAYYLAAFHADLFSYIFPLSGRLPMELTTNEMVSYDNGAKIIAFHGKQDKVVGLNQGKAAVQNLIKSGIPAELVTFDGGHLDVFMSANKLFLNRLSDVINEIEP